MVDRRLTYPTVIKVFDFQTRARNPDPLISNIPFSFNSLSIQRITLLKRKLFLPLFLPKKILIC